MRLDNNQSTRKVKNRSMSKGAGTDQNFSSQRSEITRRNDKKFVNRSNLQQMYDKYISQARDAVVMGDKILAERNYQHAEHFLRVIKEKRIQKRSFEIDNSILSNEGDSDEFGILHSKDAKSFSTSTDAGSEIGESAVCTPAHSESNT
jgi:hypothetical protein